MAVHRRRTVNTRPVSAGRLSVPELCTAGAEEEEAKADANYLPA